jgi:hypothetical protein
MLPQHRYRHPKFLQQDQSPRCCSRQRARSHQSGCPVLLVPFQTCPTGQRRHRTGVPVVCSSPDYMACHSQIFPSMWASARSDDLPVLTQSAPEIRVLPMSVQGPGSRASHEDPRRATVREMTVGPWSSAIGWISTHRNLLWSKATVVNVAMVEQCERSPRSAVPVANGRPERPLQNVGDLCSGTDIWKAVEDIAFACACACARRCNTSITSRPLA